VLRIEALDGPAKGCCLICEHSGKETRLRISSQAPLTTWQLLRRSAREQVNTVQLDALENAPWAVCITDERGDAVWNNHLWEKLPETVVTQALQAMQADGENATPVQRITDDEGARGFEIQAARQAPGHALYVSDVTDLVRAENAQRKFVQTLTKTFANLTTGLAVFDRNQELALFNPALLDLTALPAAFLTARPHVMSFFDGLRDRQVMPEPRSYAKWRTHILEMIESASDGLYQENWALPSGLTYRITGRPHPDGAVAFLIEDITDEMSIKRRFRAQLDLRQLVLDEMDDAITVFDSRNLLMFCNHRCADLLGIDPDSSFADLSTADIIKAYTDTPLGQADWGEVERNLASDKAGLDRTWVLQGRSAQVAECRVRSLSGGVKILLVRPLTADSERPMTTEHA
jgi:PAS domain-containing protein